ncbi:MAG: alpha/beta hydrolase [Acidobacteriota bacterium]|nr:alpha/beta hydrolase [Acidobacteriota bacterium]
MMSKLSLFAVAAVAVVVLISWSSARGDQPQKNEAPRAPAKPAAEAAEQAPAQQPGPLDLFAAYSRVQLANAGFQRREAEEAGGRLVWWEKGEGAPLVLIHGVTDQAGTWFSAAPMLAEEYRVLLVDLPGHGESAPAAGPLKMTTVVESFEGWLQAHGVTEGQPAPILVGNSMGAWVAMLAALHHPAAVSRVVAINGGPLRADTGELSLLPKDREEARRLMAALRGPDAPPTPDAVLDDLVRRAKTGQAARMFQAEADLDGHLLEGRLGEISTPVDLLWGEADEYLGRDYPQRLLDGLPNARLTWIERCGHVPQVECPAKFAAALPAVLAQSAPGPAESGDEDEDP